MAIIADRNLYPGVNAHLNSYLQLSRDGMWEPFHFRLISQLADLLEVVLPDGYDVLAEKSLQIGEYELEYLASVRKSVTKSDITIYRSIVSSLSEMALANVAIPSMILPLEASVDDEDLLTSVVIFASRAGSPRPVTRIEILSPANKPGHSHHEKYLARRLDLLKAGLCIVEIDLLHHTRPINPALPVYKDQESGAAPYCILVTVPRPSFEAGKTAVYQIGVIDPLPTIAIPLDGADQVVVDFNAVYHKTFMSRRFKAQVNYAEDPPAFDRYTSADQDAIRTLLEDIRSQYPVNP
jgi:hypothetical protein